MSLADYYEPLTSSSDEEEFDIDKGGNAKEVLNHDGISSLTYGDHEGHPPEILSEERLKLEDALNYMDLVKCKFGNQPQVTNEFLEIMKLFKTQSIGTADVISRVSYLFRDRPELIVGFNMFLPEGYKIEVDDYEQVLLNTTLQEKACMATNQTGVLPCSPRYPLDPVKNAVIQHSTPGLGLPLRTSITHAVHDFAACANTFETGTMSPFPQSFPAPFVHYMDSSHQCQSLNPINYVNRVKNRFQKQPEKYVEFVEIMVSYQKDVQNIKAGLPTSSTYLTEPEVYSQVAKLLENEQDLLQEFKKFLTDTDSQSIKAIDDANKSTKMTGGFHGAPTTASTEPPIRIPRPRISSRKNKLSSSSTGVNFSDTAKYSVEDFAIFGKDFMQRSQPVAVQQYECMLQSGLTEHSSGEHVVEIDLLKCKRLGANYYTLPKHYEPPSCSGRTALCNEVLNDVFVSSPTCSFRSKLTSSRKTKLEEHMFHWEDERYELDILIETNASAIRELKEAESIMSEIPPKESDDFKLDQSVVGTSLVVRAIRTIYGDTIASFIIDGLKKKPCVAIPLILERLRSKEEEWREAQRECNKMWRDQGKRFHYKIMQPRGKVDLRKSRAKPLNNEVQMLSNERGYGGSLRRGYGGRIGRGCGGRIGRGCGGRIVRGYGKSLGRGGRYGENFGEAYAGSYGGLYGSQPQVAYSQVTAVNNGVGGIPNNNSGS